MDGYLSIKPLAFLRKTHFQRLDEECLMFIVGCSTMDCSYSFICTSHIDFFRYIFLDRSAVPMRMWHWCFGSSRDSKTKINECQVEHF